MLGEFIFHYIPSCKLIHYGISITELPGISTKFKFLFHLHIHFLLCWYHNIYFSNQGRTPGEAFVPKSVKEAEMEKLMKSMEVCRHIQYLTRLKYLFPFNFLMILALVVSCLTMI